MKRTIIAITSAALVAALPLTSTATGIPVVDVSAIAQSIKNGFTEIQQLQKQIAAYELQVQQYRNQILNTTGIAQAAQIWQNAQGTINQVMGTVNMFRSAGGVQSYLQNFQNVNYWTAASPSQFTNQTAGSVAQKTANDQLVRELSQQEQQLTTDAANLQRLQSAAGSTQGQKAALDAAAQLSALMNSQLLQIRTLLVTEQQALAARNGTVSNQEAMQQAATQKFFQANITTESASGWHP